MTNAALSSLCLPSTSYRKLPDHVPSRRLLLPALALLAAVGGLIAPLPATATGQLPAGVSHPLTPQDPRISRAPSARFVHGCRRVGSTTRAQYRCQHAALSSFDRARAAEGLGPMTLPVRFARMNMREQLLVVTNIERVDRGLRPARLSTSLNRLAQAGARHRSDPPLSRHGNAAGGNWAGVGRSTLLADYDWVYDDGPGSPNVDCGSGGGGGCWGHRDNVLGHFSGPLKLGAAWHRDPYYGASIATEWVGRDRADSATGPGWHAIAMQIPPGLAPHRVRGHRAGQRSLVRLWASGRRMRMHLRVASGGASWSISRHWIRIRPGHLRFATLTYRPHGSGSHRGVLTVTCHGMTRRIRLVG